MTSRPQPNVVGAHCKKIAGAATKINRLQASLDAAVRERDAFILDAHADYVPAGPIAKAAGIGKDRVWQIFKRK